MKPRTVYSMLEETAALYGDAPALHQPYREDGEKKYRVWTWQDFQRTAQEIACGLRCSGIGKGDVVALNSGTRAEFYLADVGIMANGSIAGALYDSYPAEEQVQTLRNCDPKAVIVENPAVLRALCKLADPPLEVLWILLSGEAEGALTLEQLCERGRGAMAESPDLFERIRAELEETDPAILYLTSGATGVPKMGLTTHSALVSNADMGPKVLPLGPRDRIIVFLPSAHIAQRVVVEMVPIRMGIPMWFSESLAQLPHEIKAIQPTFLLAPPRVWERIYTSICTEIRKRSGLSRRMFYGALGAGVEASRRRRAGKPLPRWLRVSLKAADRLVFSKIRERLGGKLKVAASGAAPLGKSLAEFYDAIGVTLTEGYGLTEGGIVSFNPVGKDKLGSIGVPLPGVEVRLAQDGELMVRSACLFSGYYKDPRATEAILRDGWLYTGDIAEIDEDGYIFITGRKKELLVSSNGKKIYPSRIESLFKTEPLVNHVLLIGDRLPYVSALFTLNPAAAETLKGMDGQRGASHAQLASAAPVLEEVKQAVKRANMHLAPFEQIRKFRILPRDLTIENGELTATMKVKRDGVMKNFHAEVAELYGSRDVEEE